MSSCRQFNMILLSCKLLSDQNYTLWIMLALVISCSATCQHVGALLWIYFWRLLHTAAMSNLHSHKTIGSHCIAHGCWGKRVWEGTGAVPSRPDQTDALSHDSTLNIKLLRDRKPLHTAHTSLTEKNIHYIHPTYPDRNHQRKPRQEF